VIRCALEFPLFLFLFLKLPREAEPPFEIVKGAADLFCRAVGGGSDAAQAMVEEMALEADVDKFFTEPEGPLEESDHQRMRETPGKHGDAPADRAGVGADQGGDLTERMLARKGEVQEVLVGRRKLVEAIEDAGIGSWRLAGALIVGVAEINDKLDLAAGHLTPLSGLRPVTTSV
jgi:hypothetical protein